MALNLVDQYCNSDVTDLKLKGVMTSIESLEFGLLQVFSIWLTSNSHFDMIFFIIFFLFCFLCWLLFDINPSLIHTSSNGRISPLTVTKEADSPT